ncbi:hypothetical protein D3C85_1912420 [compost metagenome]
MLIRQHSDHQGDPSAETFRSHTLIVALRRVLEQLLGLTRTLVDVPDGAYG